MAMKNPPHPGKLVEANLEELQVSVADAAKAMKVTRQQLYNVTRGKSAISPDMAIRLEKAFGLACKPLTTSRKRGNIKGSFLSAVFRILLLVFRLLPRNRMQM